LPSAGHHAGLHGQRVLAQAFARGPFGEQVPGLFTAIGRVGCHCHTLLLSIMVRQPSGFLGSQGSYFGLSLYFYLTIMVHLVDSSTNCGATGTARDASSGAPRIKMATSLVSVETREVVRCEYCRLM